MILCRTWVTWKWVMLDAEVVLHHMYETHTQFTSHHQCQMLTYIVKSNNEIVAVLHTEADKSLLYILSSQLSDADTTVVVLLLIVLKQEMKCHCRLFDIEFYIWEADNDLDSDQLWCSLLFVFIDQTVQSQFCTVLNQLHMTDALDWIVMNECHLILITVSYCFQLWELQKLCCFICQFVFLMSTLSSEMISQFEHVTLLSCLCFIWGFTLWSDLCYSVEHTPDEQLLLSKLTTDIIHDWLEEMKISCRAIIYCQTCSDINEILFILSCSVYYFDFEITRDKKLVLKAWQKETFSVMIIISAFDLSVNQNQMWLVIHLSALDSLIDFAQKTDCLDHNSLSDCFVVIHALT